MLQVGDRVKLNPNITSFMHGRGNVSYSDIGVVRKLYESLGEKKVRIDFPHCTEWNGLESEVIKMELEEDTTCCECGEKIEGENYYFYDGQFLCEYCYENYYSTCEDCGEVVHNDNIVSINDGDRYICECCLGRGYNYYCCEDCGQYFTRDNIHSINGNYYCDNCAEEHPRLYDYHEFESWQFFKGKNENTPKYYIGSEIELEPLCSNNVDGVLKAINEKINAVGMYDGSLKCGGVEVVTHPETYEYKLEHRKDYEDFFNEIEDLDYGDDGGCGLHFHISRPSDEVVARIIVIVESFKNEIKRLSRRDNFGWCKFLTDNNNKMENLKLQSYKYIKDTYCKKYFDHEERYHSINLTNDNTIEYRFFNGANNFEEYWSALQFIKNVTDIALDTSKELTKIKWKDLLVGEELVNQAKQLGVYDIDKYVKDTTNIIEEYETKMNRIKGEIKRTLKNLVKYATKEISNIDMSYIKESRLDNVSTKLEDFIRDFNYRKRYLDRVLELYNYLQDNATSLDRVKNHWNDISNSYPINTQRYSRYDKLIRKAIEKYESEVEE